MNASAGKKKIPLTCVILVAITGVLVILAISTAAFFFIRYRQAGGVPAEASQ